MGRFESFARGLALSALFGAGLLGTGLVGGGLAHADRTGGYPVSKGDLADRFSFSDHPGKVLRVPHPGVFSDGRLHIVGSVDRRHFAEVAVAASGKLRHDGAFVARFGKIVAKVTVENDSWTEESTSYEGVGIFSLHGKREKAARQEMAEAIEMAEKIVPNVDKNPTAFRFNSSDGKIVHWAVTPEFARGTRTEWKMVRELGEGANARAYEVASSDPKTAQFRVLKLLKPYAPRRMPSAASEATLDALSKEAEYLSTLFANDAEFVERFGKIIPETRAIAPGVIVQEMARGKKFDDLSSSSQEKAREEIAELRTIAARLAPGVLVTGRPQNYLFADGGKISSLYDIASDGHRAYQKAGLTERVFAHRRAEAGK